MNGILPTPINKKKVTKALVVLLLLLCVLPTVLNIACLTPIYFNLENNTLYRGSAVTLTLKYVSDFFDLLSFSSVYAIIIFSLVLLKKKSTLLICVSYVLILLLKIPAKLLMNLPLYGTIGTTEEIIADLISLSFYFILEAMQLLFVFIFSLSTAKSFLRAIDLSATKKVKSSKNTEHVLPIKKFINWYNPLLRSAVYMSIVIITFRVFSRIITDIGAGAPTSFGEVMIMIVNYLTDAVYGAVAYIIAILVFNVLYDRTTKTKPENENKTDEEAPPALFND